MTKQKNILPYNIARHADEQGARPPTNHQVGIEKFATGEKLLPQTKQKESSLNCRLTKNIATINIRPLRNNYKIYELTYVSSKYNIDIACIQEDKLYHPEETIRYCNTENGWTLVTSPAEKTTNNATIRGVGMFMSPKAYKSLVNVESISPQIMVTTFSGNPKTTVISCYSPTNCSDELEIQNFYHQLTDSIKKISKHYVLIIENDMNAKIDNNKCVGNSYHNYTNRNGKYLLDLTIDCGLVNISTNFQKNKEKLWTFTYPNGTRTQLDYILIDRKWKNSAIDRRSFNTYSPLESDHRIYTAKIRLSLSSNISKSKKTMNHDWSKLLNDANIKNSYAVEIRNLFEQLQNLNPDNFSTNDIYENIMKAHAETAKKYVLKKIKPKRDLPWENDVVCKKRNELNGAFKRGKEKTILQTPYLWEKLKKI